MSRARAACAAGLALAFGGTVLGVTATIDPIHQAKASTVVRPIIGDDDLLRAVRANDPHFELRTSAGAPFLPQPKRALPRIASAAGVRLEDVRLVDTDREPLSTPFRERPRRLKVVVENPDPERAARGANAFLAEYIDYRRLWYARVLGETERYLRAKLRRRRSGERRFPSGPPNPDEALAAANIVRRLEEGTMGPIRPAPVPSDPIAPGRGRDTAVAAIIGGLLGWFTPASWLPGRWPRRRDRRR